MNKLLIALTFLLFTSPLSAAIVNFNGSFQLLDATGNAVAPTDTNVTGWFEFDFVTGTGSGGQLNSGTDLLGSPWQANNITMQLNANGNVVTNMTFDWNNNSIAAVVVFGIQATGNPNASILTTLDGDNDGIPGNALANGAKKGSSIVLNGTASVVPVPAAFWLFGSGLLGLFGFCRRKKISQ